MIQYNGSHLSQKNFQLILTDKNRIFSIESLLNVQENIIFKVFNFGGKISLIDESIKSISECIITRNFLI